MDNIQEIKAYAATLSLVHTKNELEKLIHEAEKKEISYTEFLSEILLLPVLINLSRTIIATLYPIASSNNV